MQNKTDADKIYSEGNAEGKKNHRENNMHGEKPCGLHCIKVHHFRVSFGSEVILEDINLHIHCGKLHVLIGKNGAGKSTLIKAILGEVAHQGKIVFQTPEGRSLSKMANLKIGYVPQVLNIEKGTPVSVFDFMAAYISSEPVFFMRRKKTVEKVKEALAVFQVEDCMDRQLSNLSGGQLQRVLLSLAILNEPNLLLLDEPVSGIDKNGMDLFYKTIDMLKRNYDMAIILVSHDFEYVKKYADEVILIDKKVLRHGTPASVFSSREFDKVFGGNAIDESDGNRMYEKGDK